MLTKTCDGNPLAQFAKVVVASVRSGRWFLPNKRQVAAAVMSVICTVVFGYETETVDGIQWRYTISKGDVILGDETSGCTAISQSTEGEITIPNELGGYFVTSIGRGAFSECRALTSVKIPERVSYIGSYAFNQCNGLVSVTIPSNVVSIGDSAFFGCGLESVVFTGGVREIGNGSFMYCKNLRELILSEGVTSIGNYAFSQCERLSSVTIPRSVLSVGEGAFEGCDEINEVCIFDIAAWCNIRFANEFSNSTCYFSGHGYPNPMLILNGQGLADLSIPEGVTSIGDYAFEYCRGLTSVTVPSSVTNIGASAFKKCDGLLAVSFSEGLMSIGDFAYYECGGVETLTIPSTVKTVGYRAFDSCWDLSSVTLSNGVQKIASYAFERCYQLENVTIPPSVTNIGSGAFLECRELNTVYVYPSDVERVKGMAAVSSVDVRYVKFKELDITCVVDFDLGLHAQRVGGGTLHQTVCYGSSAVVPKWTVDYGWTFVGWSKGFDRIVENTTVVAQWECVKFSETIGEITWEYLLQNGVAVLDNNGNAAASGTVEGEIAIPATLGGYPVKEIGAGAFKGCANLTAVIVPQGVTHISGAAFEGCTALGAVKLPEAVTALGVAIFAGCSNLVSVVLPEGVTAIPPRAFEGCAALEELVIPAGVRTIGEEAFAGCASLKAVVIPEGVTEIAARTFAGCEKLSSVKLPESVERIGEEAFAGCAALGAVTIPANVSEIGENAFGECKGLGSVRFYGQPPTGIWTSGLVNEKVTIHGPADVTISPADRTVFGTDLAVTLATSWAGGVVRYTLDGSAPTAGSPAFGGITVHNKTTVRAATFVEGLRWSEIAEATYGVGKVATPTATSTQGGTFSHNGNLVTLDCATAGVEIRYTFGGEPTTNSALYTGPFEISRTTTVRAKAFGHPDYVDSDVMTAEFVRAWEGLATPAICPEGGLIEAECELVAITCESEGVTIYYTLDGSRPSATNGRVYAGPFKLYQSATVKAIATKYDWADSEVASVTFTREDRLGEALNHFGAKVTNDANAPWTVDAAESHDGVSAVRSAAMPGGQSGIKLTVKGAGRLSFWWKASCEEVWDGEYYDYGIFAVGSDEKAKIAGQTDWQRVVIDLETTGKHTLHWDYAKDDDNDEGKDCIWVDQVVWVPADGSGETLTTGVPVPYSWLEGYGLGLASDFETAGNAKTGKRSALGKELTEWEDYVTGTNPTNLDSVFRTFIDLSGGTPKISWEPDLNENGARRERVYQVWGAKSLDGQWLKVDGDEEKYNFFTTTVGLP